MKHKNSVYPKDWLQIAEKDFSRVESLLKIDDYVAAGFYLQQSIEKFLKAFLLDKGWKLKRFNDLEVLINEAIQYDPEFEQYRAVCQLITTFYFTERYPFFLETELSENDVVEALNHTRELVDKIRIFFK